MKKVDVSENLSLIEDIEKGIKDILEGKVKEV